MTFRSSFLFTLLITTAAHADSVALQVLDEINLARAEPQRYAEILSSRPESFRGSDDAGAAREAIEFLRIVCGGTV